MAQSYVWKVSYVYRKCLLDRWKQHSKVFINKAEALTFENKMKNDPHAKGVKLEKWFG